MPKHSQGTMVQKFPIEKQARMDDLLDRCNRGRISRAEKMELESLVEDAEKLMVANSKRLAQYCRRHGGKREEQGTPVTVWVREPVARS